VTAASEVIVTEQEPAPEHAPPHPANLEPLLAAAERVTVVPSANVASQFPPQSMPAGCDVTRPEPLPPRVTVSLWLAVGGGGSCSNVAVTLALEAIWQPPFPEQSPLHPANRQPAAGAADKPTLVPLAKEAAQVAPQSMPAGVDVTRPLPATRIFTSKLIGPPPPPEPPPVFDVSLQPATAPSSNAATKAQRRMQNPPQESRLTM
jgi:hypothetical protein